MVFSSAVFIFFFLPIFIFIDRILRNELRNYLLIIASLLFYVWGEGTGVILLVLLCLVNLAFGKLLINNGNAPNRGGVDQVVNCKKLVLAVGVIFNLGVLLYYKYLFWIVTELSAISVFNNLHVKEHALPLGISFFTFHAISYLVDVYKGVAKQHSGIDFATYFFMFPHLVAGPIVRFEGVRHDIQHRTLDRELFAYGAFRFILGVNKKVLIANSVAPIADLAFFSQSPTLGAMDAWLGILAYTVQIYFDFSGYSDMAIGLAAMMGIKFDENFLSPYRSLSIKEFWRRWHISLSSWLRDYLFIPLGGSRCSKIINYRNLVIVFVLCGLWHGAQFTFLVWGLYHGALLIVEKTRIGHLLSSLPTGLQRLYCILMVIIGWVFFRAVNLNQAITYLGCMFSFGTASTVYLTIGWINLVALVLGLGIALFGKEYFIYKKENSQHLPVRLYLLNLIFFILSLAILYTNNRNPFIYFNF